MQSTRKCHEISSQVECWVVADAEFIDDMSVALSATDCYPGAITAKEDNRKP